MAMISTTGLHAVRAMAYLARLKEGTHVGAVAIAKEIHAPRNYLGKLLQSLTQSGLLVSLKGHGGGFSLAKSPKKISLFDVLDALEGIGKEPDCFFGWKKCSDEKPCAMHKKWKPVRERFCTVMEKVSIKDVAEGDLFEG